MRIERAKMTERAKPGESATNHERFKQKRGDL